MEKTVDDIETKMDSMKININEHEEKIKNMNVKLLDYNIVDILKVNMDEKCPDLNVALGVISNMEKKCNAKIKFIDEKVLKLDQNNFKLARDTQNVKNTHDLLKRNIENIKKKIEDIYNKNEDIDKKADMNYEQLNEKFDSQVNRLQKLIDSKENIPSNKNLDNINKLKANIVPEKSIHNSRNDLNSAKDSVTNENVNVAQSSTSLFDLEKNKNFRNVIKKIEDIEHFLKYISKNSGVDKTNKEIQNMKNDITTNYATKNEHKELIENLNNLQKQMKYDKQQIDDYISDKTDYEEIQILKKKMENTLIKMRELENVTYDLSQKMNEKKTTNQEVNIDNNKYLETKIYENFKSQILKEFANINENFEHSQKMAEEILESLKSRTAFKDLKSLEDLVLSKLEDLKIASGKKFADKIDTTKLIKCLEQQIKYITQVFITKIEKTDSNWLLAKNPINTNNICASCDSYIGELKENNNNAYIPWKNFPVKDPNDKLYRLGNGYSKMLQMINMDENNKKINGFNTYSDFSDVMKKVNGRCKTEYNNIMSSRDANSSPRGKNVNKAELPKIKKKKKTINKDDVEIEKDLNVVEESDDDINQPKITKIYRMK